MTEEKNEKASVKAEPDKENKSSLAPNSQDQEVKEENKPSSESLAKEKKEPAKEEKVSSKKAPKEEDEVKVPAKFKKLVEEIEKMSVLDLAELVKILEKKFGVSAASPMAFASPSVPGSESGAAPAEEKSEFNIVLTAIGDKKIEVIKVVRDATQKGLKESKDLVDAAAGSPQVVKENVKKEEAEELKKRFEAAGGKVELK